MKQRIHQSITVSLAAVLLTAGPLLAATSEQQQVIINACEHWIDNPSAEEGTVNYFVSRITGWTEIEVDIDDAVACLRGITGDAAWNYDRRSQSFSVGNDIVRYQEQVSTRISELREQIDAYQRVLTSFTEYEAARADAFIEQTQNECIDWYNSDRRGALTNPVCYEVFSDIGVPLNMPEGLSTEVVAEAQTNLSLVVDELDFILEHQVLPQDYQEPLIVTAMELQILMNEWGSNILQKIEATPNRPQGNGAATVRLQVEADGTLHGSRILISSGSPDLDNEILSFIDRSAPYPEAPEGIEPSRYNFDLPLRLR